MSFRDDILPAVADVRALAGPDGLDARTVQLWVRVRIWSGGEVGLGVSSDDDTEILPRPHCHREGVNKLRVEHITPGSGGISAEDLQPTPDTGQELMYVAQGADGVARNYACLRLEETHPFSFTMWLESLDRAVPY